MWVREEHRLCPCSFFRLSASRTLVEIPVRVYMVPVYLPVKLPEERIGSFIFSYLQFSFLHLSDVLDFSSWSLGNSPRCFPGQTAAECLLIRRLSVRSQGKVHGRLQLQFHCLFLNRHLRGRVRYYAIPLEKKHLVSDWLKWVLLSLSLRSESPCSGMLACVGSGG